MSLTGILTNELEFAVDATKKKSLKDSLNEVEMKMAVLDEEKTKLKQELEGLAAEDAVFRKRLVRLLHRCLF